jgi:hypothetical protein
MVRIIIRERSETNQKTLSVFELGRRFGRSKKSRNKIMMAKARVVVRAIKPLLELEFRTTNMKVISIRLTEKMMLLEEEDSINRIATRIWNRETILQKRRSVLLRMKVNKLTSIKITAILRESIAIGALCVNQV